MSDHHMGTEGPSDFQPTLSEKDRRLLESVPICLLKETEPGPSKECYIHSNAFDKLKEYITGYKNVLISVKQEYEAFIARIKNGQRNAFFCHGTSKALESESAALLYYRKRAMELEDKIKAVQKNSAKIKNVILEICNVRNEPSEIFGIPEKTEHPLMPIPGLSVEESLSLDSLSKHLAQLDRRVLELKKERGKTYVPRQKTKRDQELQHLLALRDTAKAKRENLKLRYARILLVGNAISAWAKPDKIVTLQGLVSQIMKNKKDERENSVVLVMSETEAVTYFVLPLEGAMGTLLNFTGSACLKGRNLPLLKYFDTLVNSSTAAGHLPNSAITLEAVRWALSE